MQTLPNGIEVPTNSDTYKLTEDLAKMGSTAHVIIPVNSATERNGLAALYPDGVLPVPTYVNRMDVTGHPIEVWDGTGWDRLVSPAIRANTQTVGAGMAADAFMSGTIRPLIQAGTFVGKPVGGNGDLTITYPATFPGGVIGGIGFSGDGVYIVSATPSNVAVPTTSSLFLRFANPNGTPVPDNITVRGTWIAVGW